MTPNDLAVVQIRQKLTTDGFTEHVGRVIGNTVHVYVLGASHSYREHLYQWASANLAVRCFYEFHAILLRGLKLADVPQATTKDIACVLAKVHGDGYVVEVAVEPDRFEVNMALVRAAYMRRTLVPWCEANIPTPVIYRLGEAPLLRSELAEKSEDVWAFVDIRRRSPTLWKLPIKGA